MRVAAERDKLVLLVIEVNAREGHAPADLARRALGVQVFALCTARAEELGAHVRRNGVDARSAEGRERNPGDAVDHLGVSFGPDKQLAGRNVAARKIVGRGVGDDCVEA